MIDPRMIVGNPVIDRLREAGFAVVPFNISDAAVGEAMTWTGCSCPNLTWEAINCAICSMIVEYSDNFDIDTLSKLGSGEITLDEWRTRK